MQVEAHARAVRAGVRAGSTNAALDAITAPRLTGPKRVAFRAAIRAAYSTTASRMYAAQATVLGAAASPSQAAIRAMQAGMLDVETTALKLLTPAARLRLRDDPAAAARQLDLIMRTAAQRALDTASYHAALDAGAGRKTWVRMGSVREPRPHSSLEGVTIPIDAMFTLPGGERVNGPRDGNVGDWAAEWMNCGHGLIYSR